jgi:hypothetical protein
MIKPSELLALVAASIASVEGFNIPVTPYDEKQQPPAKNAAEVFAAMSWPNALLVYAGFDLPAVTVGSYRHRFELSLRTGNQVQAMNAVQGLLDGIAEGRSVAWNLDEITDRCDPPSDISMTPQLGDDDNEFWVLRFSLQEKGMPES